MCTFLLALRCVTLGCFCAEIFCLCTSAAGTNVCGSLLVISELYFIRTVLAAPSLCNLGLILC